MKYERAEAQRERENPTGRGPYVEVAWGHLLMCAPRAYDPAASASHGTSMPETKCS
jgi:hypothetical protein